MQQSHVKNNIIGGIYLTLLFTLLLRWSVSLYSYSGQNVPPMYGDYEAQRHWMEITYNLPVTQWYENSTENDLLYWGLDYPPLTAYHSYLSGWIFSKILPKSVELYRSRGFESYLHKFYMRLTVLISDILFFYPPVYLFFSSVKHSDLSPNSCTYLALAYPGLILIDHGHFQYNCISLGLFVFSVYFISKNYDILASIFFTLALNYKQMELYHSLPFFCYFLGKFFHHFKIKQFKHAIKMIFAIATTVIISFLIIWFPFLSSYTALQVFRRLFPVSRGIFEDKVSNFWCILNVVYKLRSNYTNEYLFKICTGVTFASILPCCVSLLKFANLHTFYLSLINCSLSFFLFSFQVHEKSILLVSIPILLYLQFDPFVCFWFLFISTFSMIPLLIKDGLFIPFILLSLIYYLSFISFNNTNLRNTNNYCKTYNTITFAKHGFILYVFYISVIFCFIFAFISVFIKPPDKYPDLWPLLISTFSFAHFFGFLIYFNYKQFLLHTNNNNRKKNSHKSHAM